MTNIPRSAAAAARISLALVGADDAVIVHDLAEKVTNVA
jgi:hypothetical protein